MEEIVCQKLSLTEAIKIERNPNVFKNWQLDTDPIIDSCVQGDFEHWKVDKFVKDP